MEEPSKTCHFREINVQTRTAVAIKKENDCMVLNGVNIFHFLTSCGCQILKPMPTPEAEFAEYKDRKSGGISKCINISYQLTYVFSLKSIKLTFAYFLHDFFPLCFNLGVCILL